MTNKNKVLYFPCNQKKQFAAFTDAFQEMLLKCWHPGQPIHLLCIGTDKVPGDSLGPFVGHELKKKLSLYGGGELAFSTPITIHGTLEHPVHAVNLGDTIATLQKHGNICTIVVDASLGMRHHQGYVTLSNMPLRPGEGVNKKLPLVGHISITGIVGPAKSSSYKSQLALRQTKLYDLMQLVDFISEGVAKSLLLLCLPTVVQGRNRLSNCDDSFLLHNVN